MPGSDLVRNCPDCQLNVYRVDVLSEKQLIDLIRSTEPDSDTAHLELYRRHDGTVMLAQGKCSHERQILILSVMAVIAVDAAIFGIAFVGHQIPVELLCFYFVILEILVEVIVELLRNFLRIRIPSFPAVWIVGVIGSMAIAPMHAGFGISTIPFQIAMPILILLHAVLAARNAKLNGVVGCLR